MKVFIITHRTVEGRLTSTRIEAETMVSGLVTFQQKNIGITPQAIEEKGIIVFEPVFKPT